MSTNILWVTFAPITVSQGLLASQLASARYRIIIPAKFLASTKKYKQYFYTIPKKFDKKGFVENLKNKDVVIFSKSFHTENSEITKIALESGIKVIFDICDNHFDSPHLGEHYIDMANMANEITAATPAMAAVIKEKTSRTATVITDPYETLYSPPLFQPESDKLKLCWFGGHTNVDSLRTSIPELATLAREIPTHLEIVCSPNVGIEQACVKINNSQDALVLSFSPWSIAARQEALKTCDIVIIPSLENETKLVKSPNRMVDSLWAGRYVVAHPLPSYQAFQKWGCVQNDLGPGILEAIEKKGQIEACISEAQDYIRIHHSPTVIGTRWSQLIDAIVN